MGREDDLSHPALVTGQRVLERAGGHVADLDEPGGSRREQRAVSREGHRHERAIFPRLPRSRLESQHRQ